VDNGVAAFEGWLERGRVGEIADDRFAANAFKVGEVAGFPSEEPQIRALGGKGLGNVVTHESCRAS
jgi:hypothetical protein